jgi:glycosyltransferase involved in cell wall biosynthesis
MKIVQIVSQMEAGGAQKVASLLTEGLRRRGHDASLWFLYKKRLAYPLNDHVECMKDERPDPAGWMQLAMKLWLRFRQEEPQVVVAHTHSANVFAAPIADLAGVPVRIAVHHNPVETYSPTARVADEIAFTAGCYSAMVAVSGGVRQSFARHDALYQSRLHRIYNGICPTTGPDNIHVRNLYRIPDEHAILTNVGRLATQKNQMMLLDILPRLPNTTLLLVGEGEMRAELRRFACSRKVEHRVRFTGELAETHVAAILEQSDLFLLPSLYESFCLAAVEAMGHALPVIASDLPCLREVLGSTQLFFPLNDRDALTAMVLRLLQTPEERATMSAGGQLRAREFNVERMVGEYECLIEEAMLYARPRNSATNNFGRVNALRGIARVHDQL